MRLPLIVGWSFVLTLAAWACLSAAASAGQRVALVVGNSDYANAPSLSNPKNDAALMRDTLAEAGFDVTTIIDADQRSLKQALLEFGRALRGDDVEAGLFYYAGHGVQVAGENYLVPVNAAITSEDEIELEAINVNSFLRVMNSSDARVNIVILDACRDNPFKAASRSMSRGLAPVDAPKGTYIAYATAPGAVAAARAPTAAATDRVARRRGVIGGPFPWRRGLLRPRRGPGGPAPARPRGVDAAVGVQRALTAPRRPGPAGVRVGRAAPRGPAPR